MSDSIEKRKQELLKEIEKLKHHLHTMYQDQENLSDSLFLNKSRELDKKLNEYIKLSSQK